MEQNASTELRSRSRSAGLLQSIDARAHHKGGQCNILHLMTFPPSSCTSSSRWSYGFASRGRSASSFGSPLFKAQTLLHAALCEIPKNPAFHPPANVSFPMFLAARTVDSAPRARPGYNVALRIKLICFDSAPCLSGAARHFEGASVSSFSHLQPTARPTASAPITTEAVSC